jgi:hypothetical protein
MAVFLVEIAIFGGKKCFQLPEICFPLAGQSLTIPQVSELSPNLD